ncbi:LysE family translocator [Alkalicoccus urumqiensis]|uniref:LysE family translocator n=1 Tax=Alkalicoccus urumqiensis TaxID=1548213 RepID=A0A2P6MJK6_ALKUR|nr:LysE family transporter [Alkalicoccus urumqiensis]PRO66468.1 hypothetical protein C6I21_03770 [Alkalicoccus urumqiensis]
MIDIYTYIALLLPFIISPGASYVLTIAAVEKEGFSGVYRVILGTVLGIAAHASLAAMGISTLLLELPQLFSVIQVIGYLMLIYLGVSILRNLFKVTQPPAKIITTTRVFLLNIFNVKPLLLYVTIIPSFLQNTEISLYLHYLYVGITHISLQITWLLFLGCFTMGAKKINLHRILTFFSAGGSLFLIALGVFQLVKLVLEL